MKENGKSVNTESKSEWDFSTVVAFSSALAFGGMLGVLQGLRFNYPEISFHFSIWTAIAFLVGSTFLFAYLRFVFTCGKRTPRAFRYGGLVVLGLMASLAFIYPLRLRQLDQLPQRFAGVAAALCFIATGFTMVYRVVLAAELDEARQEAEEKDSTVVNSQPPALLGQKEQDKQIVEVPGARNSVYVSRPKEVAVLVEGAASRAKNEP